MAHHGYVELLLVWFGGAAIVGLADCARPEWLPIFKHLELIQGQWKSIVFPPNMCGTRDIPEGADFHPSVKARMLTMKDYRPTNDGILKV